MSEFRSAEPSSDASADVAGLAGRAGSWNCAKCGAPTGILCGDDKLCAACWNALNAAWQKRMAIRQDPAQFNMDRLVRLLLTQHWMHECRIIPDYMPPFPRADTRPTCQVQYTYDDGTTTGLRYSHGPMQGYFWDIYGDDFHSPEMALIALANAPAPARVHAVVQTHGR